MAHATTRISSIHTVGSFLKSGACSETVLHVLGQAFGGRWEAEERAAKLLAGGVMEHGYQCGMIWGAALAAGAEAYRRFGSGPHAEAKTILSAQRLGQSFRDQNQEMNCLEITELDLTSPSVGQTVRFFAKGGPLRCMHMAARYPPMAFREIQASFSEAHVEAPCAPVSCSAMLAQKTGASDMHTVMAAGLAGGIGLSGGACGALGAALWIAGMNSLHAGAGSVGFRDSGPLTVLDRFLKCTDYTFECSDIVGHTFQDVDDHARHVREGGCSAILDALAFK
jgi:hypothetical protein